MPTTRLRPRAAPIGYILPRPGTPESERTTSYRARKAVVRRLEQLIAQGKLDQAIQFALPITALLDTAPTIARVLDILDELTLVDAREDVARQLYRQNPERHRGSYKAHLHQTIQRMTTALRAIEAEEDACS